MTQKASDAITSDLAQDTVPTGSDQTADGSSLPDSSESTRIEETSNGDQVTENDASQLETDFIGSRSVRFHVDNFTKYTLTPVGGANAPVGVSCYANSGVFSSGPSTVYEGNRDGSGTPLPDGLGGLVKNTSITSGATGVIGYSLRALNSEIVTIFMLARNPVASVTGNEAFVAYGPSNPPQQVTQGDYTSTKSSAMRILTYPHPVDNGTLMVTATIDKGSTATANFAITWTDAAPSLQQLDTDEQDEVIQDPDTLFLFSKSIDFVVDNQTPYNLTLPQAPWSSRYANSGGFTQDPQAVNATTNEKVWTITSTGATSGASGEISYWVRGHDGSNVTLYMLARDPVVGDNQVCVNPEQGSVGSGSASYSAVKTSNFQTRNINFDRGILTVTGTIASGSKTAATFTVTWTPWAPRLQPPLDVNDEDLDGSEALFVGSRTINMIVNNQTNYDLLGPISYANSGEFSTAPQPINNQDRQGNGGILTNSSVVSGASGIVRYQLSFGGRAMNLYAWILARNPFASETGNQAFVALNQDSGVPNAAKYGEYKTLAETGATWQLQPATLALSGTIVKGSATTATFTLNWLGS